MSYGRHQSFYLKDHWINKGIKALKLNTEKTLFIDKDGFKDLGIGKNMQQALRYWLEATNIIELSEDKKTHNLTFFGSLIDDNDPACNLNFTKLLVHFYLISQTDKNGDPFSHSFHWFYIINKDNYISKEKIKEGINSYSQHNVSLNTINRDTDCLIQTYTNKEKNHPEDKNVALLADLDLLLKDKNFLVRSPIKKDLQGAYAFYYALVLKSTELDLNIDSITNNIGAIFNLNRTEVIEIIDTLINENFPIEITRTNNLDTVSLKENRNIMELLIELFSKVVKNEK